MNRVLPLMLVCLASFGLAGCGDTAPNDAAPASSPESTASGEGSGLAGKLTLTGSSTIAPLAAEIAKRFEEAHPDVRIDVQTGGSSRGIRDAHSGAADVGMSSRTLKPEEQEGVKTVTIGWDGVAFVVHSDNPVTELSKEQLVAIYTGTIDNWRDAGGGDAPIIVSNRAEGRSELDLMTSFLELDPTQIEADVIDGETQQTIKTVTTNVNAIMYTSVGAAQHAAESGSPLRLLPLGGVPASTTTVQSGDFPLARPLVLIQAASETNPLADAFVSYALSPDVDDLTESLGYVPPSRDGE